MTAVVLESLILVFAVLGSVLTAWNKPGYSYYGFTSYVVANLVGFIYFANLERWIMVLTYSAFLIASLWGMYNHRPVREPSKFRGRHDC